MSFENSKISQNIAARDRKRVQTCPGVLAGANFNAWRRVGILLFLLFSFHGAKRSSLGRRSGNPGGGATKICARVFQLDFPDVKSQ